MTGSDPTHRPLDIGTLQVTPALLLAPMAGVTHSAFRRLVSDFGGYGALCTEMLSARAVRHENLRTSPFTRRRPEEGTVVYQLLVSEPDEATAAIGRLKDTAPDAIDINLGCPAPEVRKFRGGVSLFLDMPRLEQVLQAARTAWTGPLSVKCRLGDNRPDWQAQLRERLALFEACGVDALTVHPRFHDEKLKRIARWQELNWIAREAAMPVIGNGDITSTARLQAARDLCPKVAGWMIGRAVVSRPWLFADAVGEQTAVDYADAWDRLCRYVVEDFAAERVLGRVKEFTTYFSRNFMFGHELFRASQGARSLEQLRERALQFLGRSPQTVSEPSMSGI